MKGLSASGREGRTLERPTKDADLNGERRSEPVFNAPWPAIAVIVSIPLLNFVQQKYLDPTGLSDAFTLVPAEALAGRWETFLTYMALHAGWTHALINTTGALAFAPAVAKLLGGRAGGVFGFFLFYIVCGVAAGLGYALLHPHAGYPVVGASGAISGLMGAAIRLLNPERRLAPVLSRTVVATTAAFAVLNAVLGLTSLTPMAGGGPVAWEAHIIGFLAGLLLIGPWAALFGPPRTQTSPADELIPPHD